MIHIEISGDFSRMDMTPQVFRQTFPSYRTNIDFFNLSAITPESYYKPELCYMLMRKCSTT